MTKQKWIFLLVTLAFIGGGAGLLSHLRANQKLGAPGVKTVSAADSKRLQVVLPERVLDYDSEPLPEQQIVLDYLPKDTSFGQRIYKAADAFQIMVNVVLMGTDRTSIHKPEFCLGGQGWIVDGNASSETTVHIDRPVAYDLPVMKLIANKQMEVDGQPRPARGIYVYWFVANNEYTARHTQRMWWMAKDMMLTGVLQRWAYVTYFAVCAPGEEDATFERMKKMIAASVPEFQLTPGVGSVATTAAK
jgi:hypothetical protein